MIRHHASHPHSSRKVHVGNFIRDVVIVLLSIIVTVLLVRIGVLEELIPVAKQGIYLGSFIAGIFFTSVFTIAPATVVLADLANHAEPITVALWGGLGAALGDLILFLFVRDVFAEDLKAIMPGRRLKHFFAGSHFGLMRWMLPVIGAAIIVSPLPDELGIGLMGFSKIKVPRFFILSFCLNVLGVLAVAAVAHTI